MSQPKIIRTVFEAGEIPKRQYDWGKGYVTSSHDTLGYGNREDAQEFLSGFLHRANARLSERNDDNDETNIHHRGA